MIATRSPGATPSEASLERVEETRAARSEYV
jgi:hypothetical protein